MPRKLNEEEIQSLKDDMYDKTYHLIQQKGLHNLTVEEITQAIPMAKGSFYHYYKTKEEFLYYVIKRKEKEYFDALLTEMKESIGSKDCLCIVVKKFILSEDSLFAFLQPEELYELISHLPKDLQEQEANKSHRNFEAISDLLKLPKNEENYSTLSYLMDSLQAVIQDTAHYGESGRKNAINIIINAIGDFLVSESEVL